MDSGADTESNSWKATPCVDALMNREWASNVSKGRKNASHTGKYWLMYQFTSKSLRTTLGTIGETIHFYLKVPSNSRSLEVDRAE